MEGGDTSDVRRIPVEGIKCCNSSYKCPTIADSSTCGVIVRIRLEILLDQTMRIYVHEAELTQAGGSQTLKVAGGVKVLHGFDPPPPPRDFLAPPGNCSLI
jgi:hypothetical protein